MNIGEDPFFGFSGNTLSRFIQRMMHSIVDLLARLPRSGVAWRCCISRYRMQQNMYHSHTMGGLPECYEEQPSTLGIHEDTLRRVETIGGSK